ncbi:hypothetical protein B0T11DRAFT_8110 [Plectosphaerella cucumerina]|uniref:Secreted protein n=1 Tax=Plectosphaerella cucumerina TaxID=40658 RepID=A0A8K0TQ47_9PEZI|nr:hypothetical protein B0T11DRAFT_8110 [Plectosphaerella cucumerina]
MTQPVCLAVTSEAAACMLCLSWASAVMAEDGQSGVINPLATATNVVARDTGRWCLSLDAFALSLLSDGNESEQVTVSTVQCVLPF